MFHVKGPLWLSEFEGAASQIPLLESLKPQNKFKVSEMSPAKKPTQIGLIQGFYKLSRAWNSYNIPEDDFCSVAQGILSARG